MVDISLGDILTISGIVITVVGILISVVIMIHRYCIRVELRFKKLEDELTIFKPIKEILIQMGEEQVVSIFKGKKS
jgi:hypothetical protein